jgi:hypothetical protein
MIRHVCPRCQAALESAERLAGVMIWCPHCDAAVEVPQIASAEPSASAQPETGTGRPLGKCSLCGAALVGVQACHVRVSSSWTESGLLAGTQVVERWVNVECSCCNDCWKAGRRVRLCRWVMFGLLLSPIPLLLLFGGLVEGLALEKMVSRRTLAIAFVLIVLGPFVLGLTLAPACVWWALKQFVGRFTPETDRRLKTLGGCEAWGLRRRPDLRGSFPAAGRTVRL